MKSFLKNFALLLLFSTTMPTLVIAGKRKKKIPFYPATDSFEEYHIRKAKGREVRRSLKQEKKKKGRKKNTK